MTNSIRLFAWKSIESVGQGLWPRRYDGPNQSSFGTDTRGNIAMMFCFSVGVFVVGAGLAIDYGQAAKVRATLQDAADAAALAASVAGDLTDGQRKNIAFTKFMANIADSPLAAAAQPVVTIEHGAAKVGATAAVPTAFMRIANINSIAVGVENHVVGTGKRIELALVTDITGSMADTRNGMPKIDGLKLAAADLLDIVLPNNAVPGAARVALVPFANYVNAGSYATQVTNLAPTRNIAGVTNYLISCVTERTGTEAYTDALPGPSAWIGASVNGNSPNNYSLDGQCLRNSGNGSSELPGIIPLSEDKTALLNEINSFTPAGSTAGHLGTAWGWYLISPAWQAIWGLATPPVAYHDPEVIKAVVIMTDGEYNTQYSSTSSTDQALALCGAMKASGIEVFTVGFGIDPSEATVAEDTLTRCASGIGHYFFPYDSAALRQAFNQIGNQLTTWGQPRFTN